MAIKLTLTFHSVSYTTPTEGKWQLPSRIKQVKILQQHELCIVPKHFAYEKHTIDTKQQL